MITMLKGGLDPSNTARYKFISGVVSDTRLMGVVAMHLIFEDRILTDNPNQHQFYYFDYEELGLETLKLLYTNNEKLIEVNEKESFAGLGAQLIELTEDEAYYLANWMIEDTKKKGQPLPTEVRDIEYIKIKARELDAKELEALNKKICVQLRSDYGAVNYYLMRCFGKDYEAAKLVADPNGIFEDVTPKTHSTFLKNKITVLSETAGAHKVYKCESLIEVEQEKKHHLIVSEVEVFKRKVVSVKKISDMKISLYEASLLLAKQEFVSVYKLKEDLIPFDFDDYMVDFTLGMTHNLHETGIMFMDFMPNNDHAEFKTFMLSDDIRALYFMLDSGQLVTAAYSLGSILGAEAKLAQSPLAQYLEITNRYQFPASIIYDFAESGYTDFNQFIKSLT